MLARALRSGRPHQLGADAGTDAAVPLVAGHIGRSLAAVNADHAPAAGGDRRVIRSSLTTGAFTDSLEPVMERLSLIARLRLGAALVAALLAVAAMLAQPLPSRDGGVAAGDRTAIVQDLPEPGGEIGSDFQPDCPDPDLDPTTPALMATESADPGVAPRCGSLISLEPVCRAILATVARPVRGPPSATS